MKKIQTSILSIAILGVVFVASPAFALTTRLNENASSTKATKAAAALTTRIENAKTRANQEIDRRVTAINALITKVSDMVRVAADQKTSISSSLSQQISTLNDLKTKIAADADIDTLKTDIKSITASYRVFLLVLPQANILVTADSIKETSQMLASLAVKLQSRITSAGSAGENISALNTLISDMNTKLTDAQTQADAAIAKISGLQPDGGDSTIATGNKTAFTGAKADIKVARADLATARADAGKIVAGLKAFKSATTTSTAVTATTTAE